MIPARLRGNNHRSGGEFEILLLEENSRNDWWAMVRPGRRAQEGTRINLKTRAGMLSGVHAEVVGANSAGHRRLRFSGCADILDKLAHLGEVPLPPYIKRDSPIDADLERYQTIYAHFMKAIAGRRLGDLGDDGEYVLVDEPADGWILIHQCADSGRVRCYAHDVTDLLDLLQVGRHG